jgi:Ner family transcriptional regulator
MFITILTLDNAKPRSMDLDANDRKILADPAKRRAWIRYQIWLTGKSMAQVADEAGVSRQCLYTVFNRSYPHMEKVVADALGLHPKDLFPERYDADGVGRVQGSGVNRGGDGEAIGVFR